MTNLIRDGSSLSPSNRRQTKDIVLNTTSEFLSANSRCDARHSAACKYTLVHRGKEPVAATSLTNGSNPSILSSSLPAASAHSPCRLHTIYHKMERIFRALAARHVLLTGRVSWDNSDAAFGVDQDLPCRLEGEA